MRSRGSDPRAAGRTIRPGRGAVRGVVLFAAMALPLARHGAGAQRPAARRAEIDRIFAPWDSATTPGCALGVVRDGRFLYERGYGIANLDYDIPNGPAMVYYVGSDSKQFTAAVIALLSLDGMLSLDDDIHKYFPELHDYGKPVTVRHLIHHTSGVRDIYGLMALAGLRLEDVFSDSAELALIARQRDLNFAPGDRYSYSNSGYFMLSELVRRVTGKPLREVADERIFRPLGMTHTHFHDDPGHVMKNRAMSYQPASGGGYRISYLQNFDKVGAGGLYTTLDDLRKWDENFYSHKVGGEALQALIHTRGVLTNGDTLPYAFGNIIGTYRGLRITEHDGALMGYRADILRFPDQHFSVLLQCNLGSIVPGPLALRVADQILADKLGPVAPPTAQAPGRPRDQATIATSADDLAALPGDYFSDDLGVTYHIRVVNGQLVLEAPSASPRTIMSRGNGEYQAQDLVLRFDRAGSAPSSGFALDLGSIRGVRFTRRGPNSDASSGSGKRDPEPLDATTPSIFARAPSSAAAPVG